ncbi:glycosyltransferase family 2 protein [Oceanimonas baumannii]|uniref:Glycosyl transferase n=1 Tax=Oceanimonas baumannii TaxID=129578 RepID=A0A235CMK9_9GAMM|nr:glycosyltransferase family A protein [Oceanimonas baumannii]OYD25676.1 glycosyl transferase [Oceanimonas baumannii]TDW56993.1 rhamnosyltransferase [Oceanimonas baumannii]
MKQALIMPLYNAAAYLPALLPVLKEWVMRAGERELLFVDSCSGDGTVQLLAEFGLGRVLTVDSSQFDHGGTRAWAAQQVKAEVLVFMTQDALPISAEAIEQLTAVFAKPAVAAAYGRQLPYAGCHVFGHHLRLFNYGEQSYLRSAEDTGRYGIKTAFLSNSFAAYRRSALAEIGWFKDGLILGEDSYAGGKLLLAGHKLAYVAEARVYHSHSYTVWQEFKRYFDIGVFHAMEPWLLERFGSPEGEGYRYIVSEFNFLCGQKAFHLLPVFLVRNAMKWLGYRLGRRYRALPSCWVNKLSMHRRWWQRSRPLC